MEHWFDTLTRSLSSQALTRRTMIAWSSRLAVAAGVGLLGRNTTIVRAAPVAAAPAVAASTCTVDDSYGVLKAVVTASSGDPVTPLTLTHTFIAEVGSGVSSSTLTVIPGAGASTTPRDDVVLRLSTTALANRWGSAEATLGRRYTGRGVSRARFSTDGRTVEGVVDGRATEPAALGGDGRAVRFKDGQPYKPLDATQGASVQQAVSALLAQSRSQLGACTPDQKSPAPVTTCSRCQLTCRQAWVECSVAAAQSSLAAGALAPNAYLGVANATCDSTLQQCLSTCKSSGACCPDFCKGDPTCCASAWGCSPPSSRSSKTWSRSWPTCPRAGTPPWPAPVRASTTPLPAPQPTSGR